MLGNCVNTWPRTSRNTQSLPTSYSAGSAAMMGRTGSMGLLRCVRRLCISPRTGLCGSGRVRVSAGMTEQAGKLSPRLMDWLANGYHRCMNPQMGPCGSGRTKVSVDMTGRTGKPSGDIWPARSTLQRGVGYSWTGAPAEPPAITFAAGHAAYPRTLPAAWPWTARALSTWRTWAISASRSSRPDPHPGSAVGRLYPAN